MPADFTVLIMAAGMGTRMRSSLPKVLHPVCGRPMLEWVIEAAREAGAGRIICITRPGDRVAEGLPEGVLAAEQREGEGTGAAVLAAREQVEPGSTVLVLSGDHPLISTDLVAELAATHDRERAAATLLTTEELDPAGYGRIVRAPDGTVERIVETKRTEGLSDAELSIRAINLGTYAFSSDDLFSALDRVAETGGERYLTGVFPLLREDGRRVVAAPTVDTLSAMGANTRADLIEIERLAHAALLERHAIAGVTFEAPDSVWIDVRASIDEDTTIGPGVTVRGTTAIGSGCEVGPQTTLVDARLGRRVSVLHSHLVGCEVEDGASVGPFAYLRPGASVGPDAKVGSFVEVKSARIGAGAKVPHLSYIGDAEIGEGSNIAAGNITANYDGRAKHRTKIGKNVRTGVHTAFVAPVSVGDGAYTGAGSVIVDDVPDGALGIARARQANVEGYADRVEGESGDER